MTGDSRAWGAWDFSMAAHARHDSLRIGRQQRSLVKLNWLLAKEGGFGQTKEAAGNLGGCLEVAPVSCQLVCGDQILEIVKWWWSGPFGEDLKNDSLCLCFRERQAHLVKCIHS